ncbi:type II secretion system F family protein [Thalassotalea mangrovi]|uniref:Type II secretion system F family protein n=1 Tax=Thalassotalea mangrovi TaxID=2572245 RepID=A0A4U1B4E9_9GAMM|nr:type II secretion system F family protein [Thalassotalea mangrovi]TKB44234.1 type II secretion system F family protein [Thalassotalea mangrovi]
MDYLLGFLNSVIDDRQTAQMAFYLVAGAAGVTLAIALNLLFTGAYSPVRAKIDGMRDHQRKPKANLDYLKNSLEKNLSKVPLAGNSFAGDKDTRRLLIHAGFLSNNALKIYNAVKLLMLLVFGAIAFVMVKLNPDISTTVSIYLVAGLVGIGYLLPGMILTRLANKRMEGLRRYFPDALDLLVVCCESGLGLLEAFQRVSKEIELVHGELSYEIGLVCSKVRVGYSMQDALHEFSERTGLEDIRGLNAVIVQSMRLGTGIAQTLRVYAEEYRDKRMQEAEEKAGKLGVKMLFPMLVCIWPSFFIVAVGPAVLKVMQVWDKAF